MILTKLPYMEIFENNKTFGNRGEQLAAKYLQSQGYEILYTNYRCSYGEIDLIGKEGDVWCFIEVKTRQPSTYGSGFLAITPTKQRRLIKTALFFLNEYTIPEALTRFDVVSIDYRTHHDYRIELIKNAFSG